MKPILLVKQKILVIQVSLMLAFYPSVLIAGLSFRNDTNNKIWLAIGFYKNEQWVSSGWYTIESGGVTTVFSDDLQQRYYYLYARDAQNNEWSGKSEDPFFCIHPSNKFVEIGREDCSTFGYTAKRFAKIDVGESTDHILALTKNTITATSLSSANTQSSEECLLVSSLVDLTSPLLERFLNIGLPNMIYRKTDIDIGSGCKLQFQVNKNGSVYVTKGSSGRTYGSFTVHIPVDVADCRVDCRKNFFSHHEDVKNMKLTLMSTISFSYTNNSLTTQVLNDFKWDDRPYFTIFGIHVSVTSISEEEIKEKLQRYNQDWKNGLEPMLQTFVNQDCKWMPAAKGALNRLLNLQISEAQKSQIQEYFKQIINQQLNK